MSGDDVQACRCTTGPALLKDSQGPCVLMFLVEIEQFIVAF